jgi:5-methylcytosine-specific restriction endonuclease McrA
VPRPPTGIYLKIIDIMQRHPDGVTAGQIRKELNLPPDKQAQLDRRRRYLRTWYDVHTFTRDGEHYHRLGAKKEAPLDDLGISLKLKAEILRDAHGRCQMCGRTIADGIKLVIDHKVPREWGGKTEQDNLWPLCTDCNAGKKNLFASQDTDLMKRVMPHKSIHVRLGELMKAFNGHPVPAYLMSFVGNQHDWMKRARELRYLGWKIVITRKKLDSGKVMAFYAAKTHTPWPADPSGDIRRYEVERARRNRARRS